MLSDEISDRNSTLTTGGHTRSCGRDNDRLRDHIACCCAKRHCFHVGLYDGKLYLRDVDPISPASHRCLGQCKWWLCMKLSNG